MFLSPVTHAIEFHANALYWQAAEAVDWALTNDQGAPNQRVSYKTIRFDSEPGFRVGIGRPGETWDTSVFYTRYYTRANASTTGNVTSTFLGGKIVEPIYQKGQVNFSIDYNVLDANIYKDIITDESLSITPILGLRGAWINQNINTRFQGQNSVLERIKNDFTGFGPKAGITGKWFFYEKNNCHYSLLADFTISYLWGKWAINDVLTKNNSSQNLLTTVGKRDFGAFTMQGFMGSNLDYKNYSLKLGYEIADWFNQYQVLDDGTGAHNNSLALQGLTLAFIMKMDAGK